MAKKNWEPIGPVCPESPSGYGHYEDGQGCCRRCGADMRPGPVVTEDGGSELSRLRAEVERLTALAYIGDHHFPDLTYKARLEEITPKHRAATAEGADLRARLARVVAALQPFADIHVRAQSHGALEIDVQAIRPGQSVLRICNVKDALEHAHAVLDEEVRRG